MDQAYLRIPAYLEGSGGLSRFRLVITGVIMRFDAVECAYIYIYVYICICIYIYSPPYVDRTRLWVFIQDPHIPHIFST